MVDVTLGSLFNLYEFSTGRRQFAMRQVHEQATQRGLADIAAHAALALEHDRQTRALDARWAARGVRPALVNEAAVQQIDVLVDRALSALRAGAEAQADVARPGDGIAQKVAQFLRAVFPLGVVHVTSMAYVEELEAVEGILEKLKGELQPLVGELGLTRQAARLEELAGEYRAALQASKGPDLSFDTVRAARARGQQFMLEAVAMIAGRFPSGSAGDVEARTALLGPILRQNEEIRRYLRSRRKVEDVNPETGDVDPGAPESGQAPEGGATPPA